MILEIFESLFLVGSGFIPKSHIMQMYCNNKRKEKKQKEEKNNVKKMMIGMIIAILKQKLSRS
jgi:hypothetical protein